MEKIFENKVAIVTGGSFGIGSATALSFAQRGAKVVIADWIEDNEQSTLNAIKAVGGEALFIKCDVSSSNDVSTMVDKTVATFGRLDFAFNNAGIEGKLDTTMECTEENWDKIMGVNLKGAWLCMKYELPVMLKAGTGAIVNCSSVAGLMGFTSLPAYTASKHALIGLTKAAALEYALQGIRINTVCPGVIKTAMVDRVTGKSKEVEQQYINMEPMRRMGRPNEVAEAVVWLCSDAASFITGHALVVDGGMLAG